MRSTGRRLDRLTLDAMLLGVALMLSYIEALLPLVFIPFPGVKLGLANLAVMIAFFRCGIADAAAVSAARVLLSGLLFGSPVSTFLAACGAVAAFAGLLIYKFVLSKLFSALGASVLSAAFHAAGQLCGAAVLLKDTGIFVYSPVMLVSSAVTGGLNGLICVFVLKKLSERIKNRA